jgi:hypothetical protein
VIEREGEDMPLKYLHKKNPYFYNKKLVLLMSALLLPLYMTVALKKCLTSLRKWLKLGKEAAL